MTSTDPRHGFPRFGGAASQQNRRSPIRKLAPRKFREANRQEVAVSTVLAERVCRGEGTFTR